MHDATPALIKFLIDAFSPSDFVTALSRCSGAGDVRTALPDEPGKIPADEFFPAAVRVLQRRRILVLREFWIWLKSERPRRRVEVDEVAAGFLSPDVPPPQLRVWLRDRERVRLRLFIPGALALGVLAGFAAWWWQAREPGEFGAYVAQVFLAMTGAFCFAVWTDPSTFSHVGTSPTFDALWPDPDTLEPDQARDRDDDWREVLRLPPTAPLDDLRHAVDRGRMQFRWSCTFMFAGWLILYLVLIGCWAIQLPDDNLLRTLAVRFFNDVSSVAVAAGYAVLTWGTVAGSGRDDRPARSVSAVWAFGLIAAVIVALVHGFTLEVIGPASDLGKVVDFGFTFVSGCVAALALGLFAGRLDQPIFNVNLLVLVVFYCYAAIQPVFSVVRYAKEVVGPTTNAGTILLSRVFECLELGLFVFACLAKIVLFLVLAWLYHSARLDFYLLRVRRLHLGLEDDWRRITRTR